MLQRKHSKQQRSRPFWPVAAIIVIALILAGGWLIDRGLPPDERDEIERHYAQGVIDQALGDLAVARAEFEQVVALDPGYKDAQERLSQVIALMAAPPTPTLAAPAVHVPATDTPDLAARDAAQSQATQTALAATRRAQAAERETLDALRTAIAAALSARVTPTPTTRPRPTRTATLRPAPTATPRPAPTATPRPAPTPTPDVIAAALARHGPQTISWVAIPAGDFIMGSSEEQIWDAVAFCNQSEGNCQFGWFDGELPLRSANTGAFEISRYEINNAQYNVCVSVGVCPRAGRLVSDTNIPYDPIFFADDYPVVAVSKDDAAAYCGWAGGRLPTEIEWEKAARGSSTDSGSGRIYPWGDEFRWDAAQIAADASAPVGSYPAGASPYGVHDMAGNAFEWTASAEGGAYVLRGGGWHNFPFRARAADRGTKLPASFANYDIGFRCAR